MSLPNGCGRSKFAALVFVSALSGVGVLLGVQSWRGGAARADLPAGAGAPPPPPPPATLPVAAQYRQYEWRHGAAP